jgi:hypothetical protein
MLSKSFGRSSELDLPGIQAVTVRPSFFCPSPGFQSWQMPYLGRKNAWPFRCYQDNP